LLARLIAAAICAIGVASQCLYAGVMTLEIGNVQFSKTLSGVIEGEDGTPLEGVDVVEVAPDWTTVIRSATTDVGGRWSLPPIPKQRIYYLRFTTKQCCFNEVRCRVGLNQRRGKELCIRLPLST
jgi:hypothetical protein